MNLIFLIKQITLFSLLLCISHTSTLIFEWKSVQQRILLRCVVDNATHLFLGVVSWLIVISYEKFSLALGLQSLLCGLLCCLLDIDHFIMAKSWRLKDATNLDSRPPFHNTTLMLSLTILFLTVTHCKGCKYLENIGWYFLIAVVSHHLRDSLRRGLWIWPWTTRPLNFFDYLILSYLFPLAIGSLLKIINPALPKTKTIADVLQV